MNCLRKPLSDAFYPRPPPGPQRRRRLRAAPAPLLRPHGLQPARLLCPWNSPGKNTGPGRHTQDTRLTVGRGLVPRTGARVGEPGWPGGWGGRLGPPISFLVEGQPWAPGRKVVGGSVAVWAPGHGWARCAGGRRKAAAQEPGPCLPPPCVSGEGPVAQEAGTISHVQVQQGPHRMHGEAGATSCACR